MHISGVFEVVLALYQHHELKFWGDEDIEKAIGGEAGMVSARRSLLPLVRRGCLLPQAAIRLWYRKSSFFNNWVGGLEQSFRFVDPVVLHFLASQAVDTWVTLAR